MKQLILSFLAAITISTAMAQQVTHTIQRAETLESIAQKYNVTVEALKQANPDVQEYVYIGMKLVIPAQAVKTETNEERTESPALVPIVPQEIEPSENAIENRNEMVSSQFKPSWGGSFEFGWNLVKPEGADITFKNMSFDVSMGPKYRITPNVSVYARLGYKFTGYSGGYKKDTSIHDIYMPLGAKFVLGSKAIDDKGFVLSVGPYLTYSVAGKLYEIKIGDIPGYEHFGMGIIGGIGYNMFCLRWGFGLAGHEKKTFLLGLSIGI